MIKLMAACGLAALALAGAALGTSVTPSADAASTTTARTTTAQTTGTTEDVSGPCDEAEHRNDPRCTGGAATTAKASGKHRRGKGKGRSGHGGRSGRG